MDFVKKQQLLKEKRKEQEEKRKEQEEKIKEIINQNKIDNEKIIHYNSLQKPFQLKSSYNSIIPLDLYTCWHTKDLPPLMKSNYDLLVQGNPKIKFHLFDEDDCRKFISENFDEKVLNAYDSLIPCSYKSDLWRYCILYKNGGIYMDIKYQCVNGFKFISLTEKEYFVRDYYIDDTYTALIVALAGNQILLNCINQIVENVKNKYYGENSLYPTGPALLGKYFTQEEKKSMEMYHSLVKCINEYYIVKGDRIILKWYDGYRDEQSKFKKLRHYGELWNTRNIYK
jgi:mannosyltransferase OCH1-like enzyme